jgi:hypothetical protein
VKKISEQLSSLHYTTWTLIVLFLWFSWGIVLANRESFSEGFYLMNSTLVRHWLATPDNGFFLLKFWFVGLCILVALLGINLVFCSWNKILRFITIRFNGPRLLMLVVHVIFGLVALGHFGGFMLGYKHDNVRLREGQSFSFQNGHEVKVAKIHFADDPVILKKSRRELTRDEFHYRSNFAEIIMSREGSEINRGRAYVLKPMRSKDIQVTLKRFTPPRSRGSGKKGGKPGVVVAVSRNPVLGVFLFIYPLMIIGMAVYLAMTWRLPYKNKVNQMKE